MKECPHCGWVHHTNFKTCNNCNKEMIIKPWAAYQPKTQKAKGLKVLHGNGSTCGIGYYSSITSILPIVGILPASEKLPESVGVILPSFVRPCPPSPEHGFVESRVIKTVEELEVLRLEALAANEASELMFTPRYDNIIANAVWTPSLLTVGPGHDGATSGKDTVSFPLSGLNPLNKEILTAANIGPNQSPYIEVIADRHYQNENIALHRLTQLRAGPVLEAGVTADYIPSEVVVEEIIQTNGEDLLEWAKITKTLKGKSGVVIWHPGGSPVDHYSVHCRENGIPIVTSFQPVTGLVLEPTTEVLPLDPEAVIRGLAVGDKVAMGNNGDAGTWVTLALMALHNSAVLRGPHSFWIGVGAAAILKLGSTAMDGESRHAHNAWHGYKEKGYLYPHYGAKSLSFHRARLSRLTQLLHYGFGDPVTPKGYGGRKWALCGAALAPMFNSIRKLVLEPTSENASQLLTDLNIAVNQAHNGGWWLNKFVHHEAYDLVPKGNLGLILSTPYAILRARDVSRTVNVERFKAKVAAWPETSIRPLRWRKVAVNVSETGISLSLKASTLPKPYQIPIPTTPALMKALVSQVGRVEVDPQGVKLVADKTELRLFTEDPLVAEAQQLKN